MQKIIVPLPYSVYIFNDFPKILHPTACQLGGERNLAPTLVKSEGLEKNKSKHKITGKKKKKHNIK